MRPGNGRLTDWSFGWRQGWRVVGLRGTVNVDNFVCFFLFFLLELSRSTISLECKRAFQERRPVGYL